MNGNLLCGRKQFSPFPLKVTLTKLWMKMSRFWQRFTWNVSPLPWTPPPSTLSPLPARSPTGTWNLYTVARVNWRRQGLYGRAGVGGKCSWFHGKSIFHMGEKCYGYWICLLFMPGNLKEGENTAQSYLFLCLSDLLLLITFFPWETKVEKTPK